MKNKSVIWLIMILIAQTGCNVVPLSVRLPEMKFSNDAVINDSTGLSWEQGRIAFFSSRPANFNGSNHINTGFVFLMSDDGSQIAYIEGTFHSLESRIAWSSDGKMMAITAYDENIEAYCLTILNEDGKECLVRNGYFPDWAQEGHKLSYYRLDGNNNQPGLYSYNLDTGESKIIVELPNPRNTLSSWSPDGKSIVYEIYNQDIYQNEIWLYSLASSKKQFLGNGQMPSWSSKNEIAYIRDGELWVFNIDKSTESQVVSEFNDISWPSWSPDGKQLLFTQSGNIYVYDMYVDILRQLTNDKFVDEAPSWRP